VLKQGLSFTLRRDKAFRVGCRLKIFTPDPLAGFGEETTKGREGKGKMRGRKERGVGWRKREREVKKEIGEKGGV